jgi:hypothetical protein
LDGSTLRATFKPTDTLKSVHDYVSVNRTDKSNAAFSLSNTFPRKVYVGAEFNTSLEAAGKMKVSTFMLFLFETSFSFLTSFLDRACA